MKPPRHTAALIKWTPDDAESFVDRVSLEIAEGALARVHRVLREIMATPEAVAAIRPELLERIREELK
jgi:hypothetical protein